MTRLLARLRRRASFANVTSAAALFVALGGTSYAAISLPDNSVGSSQIRYHAVGWSDIRPNAVHAWQIKRDAVGRSEIRPGAVHKWEIAGDSVGTSELRRDSVNSDKIAANAVTGPQIKDGSVGMSKLDDATRNAIAARAFRADVTAAGGADGGNAKSVAHTAGSGVYTVDFGSDVSKCTAVATLANVDAANAGVVTVSPGSATTAVTVHTFAPASGATPPTAADLPFHVVVAC